MKFLRSSLSSLGITISFFCLNSPMAFAQFSYEQAHSDSGISRRPLATIHQEFAGLASAQGHRADWIQYGTSVSGKRLMVLKVHDKNFRNTPGNLRPAILISEAIHGNEYLHITDRLPFEFMKPGQQNPAFEAFLGAGGVIYFVPVMNPDGYSAGRRENARGADLNRDFRIQAAGNQGFAQPETRGITDFIASESMSSDLLVEASMEYHCCVGGLIHPWAYTRQQHLTGDQLARHQEVGEIVSNLFSYPYGTVNDLLGYGAIGGSDDYYLEKYGRRAFSFEGARGAEDKKLQQHVILWNRVFDLIRAN